MMGSGSSGNSRVTSGPRPEVNSTAQLNSKLDEYTDPSALGASDSEDIVLTTDKGTYRTVSRGRGDDSFYIEVETNGQTRRIGSNNAILGRNLGATGPMANVRADGNIYTRGTSSGDSYEAKQNRRRIASAIRSDYRNS